MQDQQPDTHTLDGYDEWDAELDPVLPWWEALDRAYEREMANRLSAAKDRLREEGHGGFRMADGGFRIEGSGDGAPATGTPPAA